VIWKREQRERLERKLIMFYTGIERISSVILEEQRNGINDNRAYLKDLVVKAEEMCRRISSGDIECVGKLLHEGWVQKKKLAASITTPAIDAYYQSALDAGASGGKILGAGGGGFLLFYCDEDCQDNVRRVLSGLKETPVQFEPQGSKIIYVSD
jgi:D-glycero-alpha-D-manno-heptose-7-phosphate kinase